VGPEEVGGTNAGEEEEPRTGREKGRDEEITGIEEEPKERAIAKRRCTRDGGADR